MKIFLASSSRVAVPILDALESAGFLSGIISSPDKPVGRGRQLAPNEFADFCQKNQHTVFKPKTHEELNQLLKSQNPDLVVTIAYGKLIKATELAIPRYGWLNIHFSQLPRWRGAAPVQRALLAGDSTTGVTIFQLDEGMDTGPVYARIEHPIAQTDTAGELLTALTLKAIEPLMKSIVMIHDGVSPRPQASEGATHAAKINKSDGRIDWTRSSEDIDRLIRAMNPWPMAWTEYRDARVLITQARTAHEEPQGFSTSGSAVNLNPLIVACGSGLIELVSVKPEGKREMPAADWLRGLQSTSEIVFT